MGISFEAKSPIYGFNPDTGSLSGWEVIKQLKEKGEVRDPYPGVVIDDSKVFNMATSKKLNYKILEYVFPESKYEEIHSKFKAAQSRSGFTYSFPGQGGDCNCATWPKKIGIPIPGGNGAMKVYMSTFENNKIRRNGV